MNTAEGGFPHSDICGSKFVCQLPAAFRRLPRPSSPVIAKASTICAYSLDPITLSAAAKNADVSSARNIEKLRCLPRPTGLGSDAIDTIKTRCFFSRFNKGQPSESPRFKTPYFFQIVKEQSILQLAQRPENKRLSILQPSVFRLLRWWRRTGSNRWPPACKAGALPTELRPRGVEPVAGSFSFGGSGWT